MSDRDEMLALADELKAFLDRSTMNDGADKFLRKVEAALRSAARTDADGACVELLKHWQRAADKLESSFQTVDGWTTANSRQVAKNLKKVREKTVSAIAALPAGESVTVEELWRVVAELQGNPNSTFEDDARALLSTFTITRKSQSEERL